MSMLKKNVQLLRRNAEPGDFILAIMYAIVGFFVMESDVLSHAVMSLTYVTAGVAHVMHVAHETRDKKDGGPKQGGTGGGFV